MLSSFLFYSAFSVLFISGKAKRRGPFGEALEKKKKNSQFFFVKKKQKKKEEKWRLLVAAAPLRRIRCGFSEGVAERP